MVDALVYAQKGPYFTEAPPFTGAEGGVDAGAGKMAGTTAGLICGNASEP